jgi:hypothetical protein
VAVRQFDEIGLAERSPGEQVEDEALDLRAQRLEQVEGERGTPSCVLVHDPHRGIATDGMQGEERLALS